MNHEEIVQKKSNPSPKSFTPDRPKRVAFEVDFNDLIISNRLGALSTPWAEFYSCYISGVRLLMKEFTVDKHTTDSWQKEVLIYQKLPYHKNIIRFMFSYQKRNKMRIFLSYYDITLSQVISLKVQNKTPFLVDSIVKLCLDIVRGLSFLHKYHIIYRNLNTDNLFVVLNSVGEISHLVLGNLENSKVITSKVMAKTTVGNPAFTAPEVLYSNNQEPYSFFADVWSLGIVIYCLLALDTPEKNLGLSFVKPKLPESVYNDEDLSFLCDIYKRCTSLLPQERPSLEMLDKALRNKQKLLYPASHCSINLVPTTRNVFETILLLGLPYDTNYPEREKLRILNQYPSDVTLASGVLNGLIEFCFPNGLVHYVTKNKTIAPDFFTFFYQHIDNRFFALAMHCNEPLNSPLLPDVRTVRRCYVLLTCFPYLELHTKILLSLTGNEESTKQNIAQQYQVIQMPLSGTLPTGGSLPSISFTVPESNWMGIGCWALPFFFKTLSLDDFLDLLLLALLEKNMLFISQIYSHSSASISSVLASIHPFNWQGRCYPVFPVSYSSLLKESKVPFIVGSDVTLSCPMHQCTIIHLEKGTIVPYFKPESLPELPNRKNLYNSLKTHIKTLTTADMFSDISKSTCFAICKVLQEYHANNIEVLSKAFFDLNDSQFSFEKDLQVAKLVKLMPKPFRNFFMNFLSTKMIKVHSEKLITAISKKATKEAQKVIKSLEKSFLKMEIEK
eukprot:TRINITY_DN5583_c0_g1_i4.p1 TRINITY_DN5583_c0_g1~~TRINITY_DN5583_c0_g1_i4.p1  ORF type:complete len:739 (-),score=80.46 TRINITY_DN5583_c0_g1_i4:84-2270(-)